MAGREGLFASRLMIPKVAPRHPFDLLTLTHGYPARHLFKSSPYGRIRMRPYGVSGTKFEPTLSKSMVESNIQNILLPVHRRKSNEKSIEKLAREIFPGKLFYGKLSGVAKVGQPAISRLTIWIIEKIIEYSLPVGRQAKPPPAAYGVCHGFCIFASEWKLDARAKAAPPQTVSRPLQNRAAKTAPSRALKLSARSVTLFAFCGQLKFSPSTSSWQALDWHS